jgi:hypothetical protein
MSLSTAVIVAANAQLPRRLERSSVPGPDGGRPTLAVGVARAA